MTVGVYLKCRITRETRLSESKSVFGLQARRTISLAPCIKYLKFKYAGIFNLMPKSAVARRTPALSLGEPLGSGFDFQLIPGLAGAGRPRPTSGLGAIFFLRSARNPHFPWGIFLLLLSAPGAAEFLPPLGCWGGAFGLLSLLLSREAWGER